jgi:hypothetical protein
MNHVLILPVHPPKVLDLIRFLQSCGKPNTQTLIMLACTTWTEAQYIQQCVQASSCAEHLQIHMHVTQPWSDHILGETATEYLTQNQNNCVVNFKKFAALHDAHACGHEFAVVVDVDTWCVGDLDKFMHTCYVNYQRKKFWGCRISTDAIGVGACVMSSQMLGPQGTQWLDTHIAQPVYNWFLDPPSYGLSDVHDMFEHMRQTHGGLDQFFMKCSWFTFDHLVFTRWMMWQQRAEILDYCDIMGVNQVPEILTVPQLLHLKHVLHINPVWVSTSAWLKHADLVKSLLPDCHMMYHVDRPSV